MEQSKNFSLKIRNLKSQSDLRKAKCFESNEETMKHMNKPKRKPCATIENMNFDKTNLL